jgi:hypothetical protein
VVQAASNAGRSEHLDETGASGSLAGAVPIAGEPPLGSRVPR